MFVVKRSNHNPLLNPMQRHQWEAFAAFNWSPVRGEGGKEIHCVYRAMSEPDLTPGSQQRVSSIGYTKSSDWVNFTDRSQLIRPELEWEKYGCEDPRVSRLNGKYYIFYTALSTYPFSHEGIKVACAITKDFKQIQSKHPVTPFNAKAMALFPSKVNGKMAALLTVDTDNPKRMARIAYAEFKREQDIWSRAYWDKWYENLPRHILSVRRDATDHVEVGAVPVRLKEGWLFIYSHIQNYKSDNKVFGIEALLLELKNPRKIIGRTQYPIMVPQEEYESYGQIPDVIFPSGTLVSGEYLSIFYGAADTTCCIAGVRIKDLLRSMRPQGRHAFAARFNKNPIISPVKSRPWESKAVFNPAAIDLDGKIHIIYRAMSEDNTSAMGYAMSLDGLRIKERFPLPIYQPREEFESKKVPNGNSGCEDPRIVKIGGRLYMCYTAYNGAEAPGVGFSSISVKDFLARRWDWSRPELISPQDIDDKDACIFPEKIKGQYIFIHRIKSHICVDFVNSLSRILEEATKGVRLMAPRYGMWDSKKIGLAGPPVKTKAGWILFYHGVSEDGHYSLGAALLNLKDPINVISRTNAPILSPEKRYEKEGQTADVVFPCGHVCRGDTIYHYYGGGDSVVCVATTRLSALLAMLQNK